MKTIAAFHCRLLPLWMALALWIPSETRAGGGAFHTLVVVNTNSADSIELGNYYADAHGIPDHQICEVSIATNLFSLTTNQFVSLLRDPILAHITNENLETQIDFVVLCQDIPTRVNDAQGVSASLFYGPRYSGGDGCGEPVALTSNTYYLAERAFRSVDGWNNTNGFITFHLMAADLPTAKAVTDRGTAAQSTFPNAAIYLYDIGDQLRGKRERQFANTQFSFTALPGLPIPCSYQYYQNMSGKTNVIGYQDGYGWIPSVVRTNNTWLPGAYADHLTSFGGQVPKEPYPENQDNVIDWMDIGATASFGTVDEPCAYLEKFPDSLMGFYYARGFTIGEAYAMAVANPYQGLFAGDPLAAPFAAPPVLSVTSHLPYQIVTGTVPIEVSAAARSNGVPAASIDFVLDDRFQTNRVTLMPTPGNQLSVVVGTRTNTATVVTNDSLFDAVEALANAVNADPLQIVKATANGDRLELIYEAFDHGGDNLPVAASAAQGPAPALTLGVGLAATNLFPSSYRARKIVYLRDNPYNDGANAGDTLTCVITLTNGVAVTNVLIASAGESRRSILERLRSTIVTNATLLATNGVIYSRLANNADNVIWFGALMARTPGPDGAGIQVDWTVSPVFPFSGLMTDYNFSGTLDDNPDDVRPRASVLFHVTPTNGVLEDTVSVDTTSLSDGIHTNDFIARDGSAVAAPSRFTLPLIVCNSSPQLSMQGTNGAAITNGEPPSLAKGNDFGPVHWEESLTNTFPLHNNGTAALTITNWTTNGAGAAAFQFTGIPSAIEAGGTSNCTVIFSPPAAGSHEASLTFHSDAIVPQTNLLFAGEGLYSLSVLSAYGAAAPAVGIHSNPPGTVLTNSVTAPAPAGGTQQVCTGWTLTSHEPASGVATQFVMTVTNDAVLTWLWTTNYWLEPGAGPHGSVNLSDSWQPAGVTTQVTASADLYYHFTNWTGDAAGSDNPLDLLMDAPKTIQANFSENLAAHDTPEWWLAEHGWTSDFDAAATNDAEPDGFPTWQEYIGDTDPTNSASYPRMDLIETYRTNFPILTWPASTGRIYHIQRCDDLQDGVWTNQPLSLGSDTWTDTNPPPLTNRYYRISPRLP